MRLLSAGIACVDKDVIDGGSTPDTGVCCVAVPEGVAVTGGSWGGRIVGGEAARVAAVSDAAPGKITPGASPYKGMVDGAGMGSGPDCAWDTANPESCTAYCRALANA